MIFPTTLVDGFSKLWLRGKGNLRVETLIPAGSMLGPALGRAHGQKQQYLRCVLQKACAKTAIFTMCSAKRVQKQQYLHGFLQKAYKNSNIYKVFRMLDSETSKNLVKN